MAWTEVQFPYASQLTAEKMGQLQANFAAIANADSGAPTFQSASLGNSIVSQGKLSTTTASGSVLVGSNSDATYSLSGGSYSWWTAGGDVYLTFGSGDTGSGVIGLHAYVYATTFYVDERYIQASPPYNLGNGDVPMFVFIAMDESNNIIGCSVAPDPPWAYHGPTNIVPDKYINGKPFAVEKRVNGMLLHEAWETPMLRSALICGDVEITIHEVEIDNNYKNRDMILVPHPFGTVHRVGMLDPFSKAAERIVNDHADGRVKEVVSMISGGDYILSESEKLFNVPRHDVIALSGKLR